jgi:peptidoglycan/xylan/chitin deacetylase (PgdA/CDA1 family)
MRLRVRQRARAGSLALALACALGGCVPRAQSADVGTASPAAALTYDHGGIVRGDRFRQRIALVFTAGDYGDGTEHILTTLRQLRVRAGIFVTGDFLRKPEYVPLLKRAVAEGHYVGPHSDRHLLYAAWDDRERSLITRESFERDLRQNIADLKALGALTGDVYFIPPYEWYNADQARWAADMGVTLFDFSPGSGSNRDYLPETDARFVSSQRIFDDILAYERRDPAGLNGYILLLHLGADRRDRMYLLLEPLVTELRARGYTFVRIDELLRGRAGSGATRSTAQ